MPDQQLREGGGGTRGRDRHSGKQCAVPLLPESSEVVVGPKIIAILWGPYTVRLGYLGQDHYQYHVEIYLRYMLL